LVVDELVGSEGAGPMIFAPNAKSLVYRELKFIASSVPGMVQKSQLTPSVCFDEVAAEIRALFLKTACEAPAVQQR